MMSGFENPAYPLLKRLGCLLTILLIAACSTPQTGSPVLSDRSDRFDVEAADSLEELLAAAERVSSPEAEALLMDAVTLVLNENTGADHNEAEALLDRVNTTRLPAAGMSRYRLLRARISLLEGQPDAVLENLDPESMMALPEPAMKAEARRLRASALVDRARYVAAVRELLLLAPELDERQRLDNNEDIWEILSGIPASVFSNPDAEVDSYELRGWLELAELVQSLNHNIPSQIQAVNQWRNKWAQHSAAARLPDAIRFVHESWNNRPRRLALLLPLSEPAGEAVHEGFLAAYYQAREQNLEVPVVTVHDTSGLRDVMPVYRLAVEQGAELVIGPLNKDLVRQLQNQRSLPVPTLALNYGDTLRVTPRDFYQFGLAPEDEILQTANLAWVAGLRNAAILTPAGEEYQRIQDTFSNYWSELGGQLVAQGTFNGANHGEVIRQMMGIEASEARASSLRDLLPRNTLHFTPRRRQDIDFLFLLANPGEGRQIRPALSFYYAGDVPVYAMPAIYDGGQNTTANRDLNAVHFIDSPWVLQPEHELRQSMDRLWPTSNSAVQRLRAMGVDSYHLYPRLDQLARFPDVLLPGETGVLSMAPDGSIRRQLLTAQFVDGQARMTQASR